MKSLSWIDVAPWITIAITLILSIIIPLLTQIANNRFQLKLKRIEEKNDLFSAKKEAFSDFVKNVGACIAYASEDSLQSAGASIQEMYLFMPEEDWSDLDYLYHFIRKHDWDTAETYANRLSKEASALLNKQPDKKRNKG